ncbi:uncharacterized protein BKCO1_11000170 [Diplodia corticola]|uniref:Uncharacterized protein n=1 Tax=Diplodia corticola TaxID=236234 RepID=A0A1J9S7N6_9PEZI|nr:uncharacterized protein BKCO1_11000170 [Diplodia corticola]OJD36503.1 hypothetical protein BKCO1_11000170 [Diplodia corticola]
MTENASQDTIPERAASMRGIIFGLSCIADMVKWHRKIDDGLLRESHFWTAFDNLGRVATKSTPIPEVQDRWEESGYGEKPCSGFYRNYDIPAIFVCGQEAATRLKAGTIGGFEDGNEAAPKLADSKVRFLNKRIEDLATEKWSLEQQMEWLKEKNRRLRSMLESYELGNE